MHTLGTLRTFKTKNFTVIADAVEEDNMDFSWDDDGSVAAKVNAGEYIVFCARVRVFCKGEEIASDYLGQCIHETLESFMDHRACGRQNRQWETEGNTGRCGSSFADMIHEACREARKHLANVQKIHIRNVVEPMSHPAPKRWEMVEA